MKILLINPLSGYFKYDQMSMPPLGLLIVAAKLREEGHEVLLIDRNSEFFRPMRLEFGKENLPVDELNCKFRDVLRKFPPDFVGITLMTCQLKDTKHIAKLIKRECGNDLKIIAGGYHPTCEPESIFSDVPELDAVVRGQGEFAITDIASGKSIETTQGVSYPVWDRKPSASDFFRNKFFGSRSIVKVNHNAESKWSKDRFFTVKPAVDLIDQEFYQKEGDDVINCYYFKKPASIVTSRGCPNRCAFCASKLMEPRLYFSPYQRMITEVESLVDQGVTGLLFYDINFPVYKKRTDAFASAMIDSGLSEKVKWVACASANNLPYDLLPKMRRAGCVGLIFGFESASQRVLDILNKGIDVSLNQKAIDACLANDIRPQSGFIIGVPGETKDDIELSLDFIQRNQLLSSLNILLPLPGTAINRQLIANGRLNPRHPDYWGLISDTNAPLIKERIYCDIPFNEFVEIYNTGMRDVCAPTWKTLYIDILGQ